MDELGRLEFPGAPNFNPYPGTEIHYADAQRFRFLEEAIGPEDDEFD